ncbi:MAG: biotin/lipoyl-containing protein, partial [Anaerolineales bacterium]
MVIASLLVENGQRVSRGDILCTVETTKATQELEAEQDGYIFGINAHKGQIVRAGEVFCIINPDPDWQPSPLNQLNIDQNPIPQNIRITQPALILAEQAGIDLQGLPPNELITVERLKAMFPQLLAEETVVSLENVDPNAVLIYGGGGHGKSLIELIQAARLFSIAGIIDDAKPIGSSILNIPVVGRKNHLAYLYQKGFRLAINAVGGIGDITTR